MHGLHRKFQAQFKIGLNYTVKSLSQKRGTGNSLVELRLEESSLSAGKTTLISCLKVRGCDLCVPQRVV